MSSGRVITIVALCAVSITICGVVAVELLRGGPQGPAQAVGLISFIGLLLGMLTSILKLDSVSQQLNGHLQQHMTAVDKSAQERVSAAIEAAATTAAVAATQQAAATSTTATPKEAQNSGAQGHE